MTIALRQSSVKKSQVKSRWYSLFFKFISSFIALKPSSIEMFLKIGSNSCKTFDTKILGKSEKLLRG